MGGKTKLKNLEKEAKEQKLLLNLVSGSKQYKFPTPKPALESYLRPFYDHFIRDPASFVLKTKSKNIDKQLLEFVRYVFMKYPVPRVLEQAWIIKEKGYRADETKLFDFKQWYICVARGGSLYKEHLKGILTKKEVHNFLNCSPHFSLQEALYFTVAISTDGNVGEASRIARSKIREKPFDDFWRNVARFFVTHPTNSIHILNDLIDYVSFNHNEDRNYSLFGSGHTVQSLINKMEEWHANMRRAKAIGKQEWEGHPIDDQEFHTKPEGKTLFWDFRQLKNAQELAAEGNAQHHCVFSYKVTCSTGAVSIWSLTSRNTEFGERKRRLTIELRNDGRIVQARGFANRQPKPDEKVVLQAWANHNHLTVNLGGYW